MLSLYRAWLPPLCLAYPPAAPLPPLPRPAPPPGAHRPIPRRATAAAAAASPASSTSTELDVVELRESPPPPPPPPLAARPAPAAAAGAVLDIACCDGPVRFSRVLNESWSGGGGSGGGGEEPVGARSRPAACPRRHAAPRHAPAPAGGDGVQYYPCKTCGCKFPSYYFVHKHRKRCHPGDDAASAPPPAPAPHPAA